MRRTWVSLAVTLGLGATAMLVFPYRAITPGTLSDGHGAQRDDCFSCHTLLAGAPVAKCVTCHKPGEIGVRSVKGEALRRSRPGTQRIHRVVAGRCDRCHLEHGSPFGRDAARRFSHELLPADVAAGCSACHAEQKPADALHATLTAECTPCHGTNSWKPATYDHERSFRFDRNHPPRCTDCHPAGTSLKEYTCTGCHEHSLDRMERKHREEGVTDLARCRRCHPTGDENDTIRNGRKREKGGDDED